MATDPNHSNDPNYAIFRIAKLKSKASIRNAIKHAFRTARFTPNADPQRKNANRVLWGEPAPTPEIYDRIDNAPHRKDSVHCIEVLMTASPEAFKDMSKKEFKDWVNKSCNHLLRQFGKNADGKSNVLSMVLHMDETTPHISAFVVPEDPETGRLNAKRWLGGRDKMRALQDHYHNAVKDCLGGLTRGVRGSKATHQQIQNFYGTLPEVSSDSDAESVILRNPSLLEVALGKDDWKAEMTAAFERLSNDSEQLKSEAKAQRHKEKELKATINNLERTNERTQKNAKENADLAAKQKAALDALRAKPLTEVAAALGLEQDTDENWKDADKQFAIAINGRKFYDFKEPDEGKGGGAIDLVKHVLGCDFQEAKAWLMSRYDGNALLAEHHAAAVREVKEIRKGVTEGTIKPFTPPTPTESTWKSVANYLHSVRGLSQKLIEGVRKQGVLYSDRFSRVVWAGKRHAALRTFKGGSNEKRLALGSDKSEAWRATIGKESDKHTNLVFAESPFDALAYMQLYRLKGVAASAHGATPYLPENLHNGAWQKIHVVYDNDDTGRKSGTKLVAHCKSLGFKDAELFLPSGVKDWNDALTRSFEDEPDAEIIPENTKQAPPQEPREAPTMPKPK